MIRPVLLLCTNPKARRWVLLLCLLTAGIIGAAVAVRPWKGSATSGDTALSHSAERAHQEPLRRASPRQNVAVQKPGPPDPEAQKTSAVSAARAADAAAELAASMAVGGTDH